MKTKRFTALLLVFVLILSSCAVIADPDATASAEAATPPAVVAELELDHEPFTGESRVAELREILTELIEAQQMVSAFSAGVDYRLYENLHLHPKFELDMADARFALMREFVSLLMNAEEIHHRSQNGAGLAPITVRMFSASDVRNANFSIYFTNEAYLDFVEMLLFFTGIEKRMLEVGIINSPFWLSDGTFDMPEPPEVLKVEARPWVEWQRGEVDVQNESKVSKHYPLTSLLPWFSQKHEP